MPTAVPEREQGFRWEACNTGQRGHGVRTGFSDWKPSPGEVILEGRSEERGGVSFRKGRE